MLLEESNFKKLADDEITCKNENCPAYTLQRVKLVHNHAQIQKVTVSQKEFNFDIVFFS